MESQARTFGRSVSGLDGGSVLADVVKRPRVKTGSSPTGTPKRRPFSLRVHCRADRTFTGRCVHSPHASRNACQSMFILLLQRCSLTWLLSLSRGQPVDSVRRAMIMMSTEHLQITGEALYA